MHLLQLLEAIKHDKNVLWDNGTYFIAGNDPTDPTFLTLWTEDNERIGQLGTRLMRRNKEEWLAVAEVSVQKEYQRERLAFRMYQALLENMPERYAGLIGYQPDIVHKGVHKIYKRLGARTEDGDYYMVSNPNRTVTESRLDEVEIGRTLYHGTTKASAKEIVQNGLEPKVGALVQMAYGEYEYDEFNERVRELEPLGFVADKEQFGAVMSAIKHHVEKSFGERHTASAEDILKYGAVLVFRDGEGDFVHRSEDHDPTDYEEHPMQVEPGDWYTWEVIKPSYVLTGQPMLRLLKRMGQWPLVGAYDKDPVQDNALKADLVRRLIAKNPGRDKSAILSQVNALSAKELGQAQWQAQRVTEAQQPQEIKGDFHDFAEQLGLEQKAEQLHDYVIPWVNSNRPGNINKMVRDPEFILLNQLQIYFKMLKAGNSTMSEFEAALDTPIKMWRGGGGDYNPNHKTRRPWISFTLDKSRVKTFSQYAGTHASPSFMLPERSRFWEVELSIPLRNILGYAASGNDEEVFVSKKDAKNARLITGKQRSDGVVGQEQ